MSHHAISGPGQPGEPAQRCLVEAVEDIIPAFLDLARGVAGLGEKFPAAFRACCLVPHDETRADALVRSGEIKRREVAIEDRKTVRPHEQNVDDAATPEPVEEGFAPRRASQRGT